MQTALGLEATGEADAALVEFVLSEAAPRSGIVYARTDLTYPTLTEGDEGDALDALQARLQELGYLTKKQVSGSFDADTAQAIVQIQEALSLSPSGEVSPALLSYLLSDASDGLKIEG